MHNVVTGEDDEANYGNGDSNDNEWSLFMFDDEQLIEDDDEKENYEIETKDKETDDEEEEEESFAADFYRCGSDWSSLLLDRGDTNNNNIEKKLKQANLLDVWGLKNNNPKPKALPLTSSSPSPFKKLKIGSSSSSSIKPNYKNLIPKSIKPRVCPFYKKIPGTPFTVDAFRYGPIQNCSAYFLTHFHADHYGGLTKGWSHGPIYCTQLTARLLKLCLYVNSSFIHPLDLNTEYAIEGVRVTLLEANHCPGAALLHFRLSNGLCYLHTGDFRASKVMQSYHLLVNQKVNALYLDTTYCNPKYKFPSKEDVLNYVVRVTKDFLKQQPETLIVVGAYSIGKECVYLSISKALGVKIYASASRRQILESFGWSDLSRSLCTQPKDTPLHVLPISSLRVETLKDYLKKYINQYRAVLAFRPTGWTYSENVGKKLDLIRPISKGNVTIYGVPYSEHSSFTELKEFVEFLKPDKIIPTVNVGNPTNREKMQSHFREWLEG
ncbi:DNA cross-link repair protein SNM1 [Ricinus communis]|uniref:DNA cross-link repair protein pso2/snm1, putative n=1 Tax=Ricinus communis TaxID=3988 RepID=B9RGU1_RICCO|nr:DNA cross-link repair protein SNM1 [Ricinus communis]EEF49303.1 DNA cross-link repair protein pso2/snm1, putative [Ricinus communis]|eukprot:XP_002512800.1 DNA cross-link repair protein SNM1 [Ricinus communis]